MHKRDYLVKQFEEFGKVMAILLGLKRDGNYSELSDVINESVKKILLPKLILLKQLITNN